MSTCDHQNFDSLPNEILIEILCKVSDQEWLAFGPLRLVCKKWYTILSSKKFWKIYHSKSRSKIPSLFYSETYDWGHIANFRAKSDSKRGILGLKVIPEELKLIPTGYHNFC